MSEDRGVREESKYRLSLRPIDAELEEDREAHDESRYRLCLRPIGAEFDRISARYVTLFETDQAFVWQAFAHGDLKQLVWGVVGLDDLRQLVQSREACRKEPKPPARRLFGRRSQPVVDEYKPHTNHPLVPESYEDFFRTLGLRLDRERATQVVVVETSDSFVVDYHMYLPPFVRWDPTWLAATVRYKEIQFWRHEIQAMIADAQRKRGTPYYK